MSLQLALSRNKTFLLYMYFYITLFIRTRSTQSTICVIVMTTSSRWWTLFFYNISCFSEVNCLVLFSYIVNALVFLWNIFWSSRNTALRTGLEWSKEGGGILANVRDPSLRPWEPPRRPPVAGFALQGIFSISNLASQRTNLTLIYLLSIT